MHITHICPRFKEIHGGGEPVLFYLFKELSNLGFSNTIHTFNFPDSLRPFLDSKVQLKQLPGFLNRNFSNVLLAGLIDLMASSFFVPSISRDTDVVCFHTEGVIPGLFFYKLFGQSKPTLYFCFQPPRFAYDTSKETARAGGWLGLFVPFFKKIYRPFDRFAVKKADVVTTFSNDYKRWIESIYEINGVKVLPPGVEKPDIVHSLPQDIADKLDGPDTKTLLSVGKLVTWKHIDRLLDITDQVRGKIPNIQLLIVGDGPCMADLREQAELLQLSDNVIFCGYVSGEEVFAYCGASDLLVLLEQNASFGLALTEANSMGLPVMAFEGGGPSDIIANGENGFLLPIDIDNSRIAELIVSYLNDEKQLMTMRQHALAVAERFTWRQFAEMFAEVVRGIA